MPLKLNHRCGVEIRCLVPAAWDR